MVNKKRKNVDQVKQTVTKVKKTLKKSKRHLRRRRSRARYYKTLKDLRTKRNTEELCSDFEVIEMNEMDWSSPNCAPLNLPEEIIEWHKQDQIAYWKAKAISLELENKMLKQHLRNIYAKTVEINAQNSNVCEGVQEESHVETIIKEEVKSETRTEQKKKENVGKVLPNVPELKNRAEEMKKIYGDKAQKILGMETATQLNFERYMEKFNPVYWPNLPLKI